MSASPTDPKDDAALPASNPTVREFVADGEAQLAYVEYAPESPQPDVAFVYLHGIESHAEWFDAPARLLCEQGYYVACLDRRGSGLNRENRGFVSGHIDSYETLMADVVAFAKDLRSRFQTVFLIGLSWGGKLATAVAIQNPDLFHGLILITPGLAAKVDVTFGAKLRIALGCLLKPTLPVAIPIEPEMFTTTPEFLTFIRNDPLRLHTATARFMYESLRLEQLIRREISNLQMPVLTFLAGQDRIIDNAKVKELLERTADVQILTYDDQTHSIQFDCPERLVKDLLSWAAPLRDKS